MPSSSPLERPSEKANTVERLMPIRFGLRSSTTATSACHCSSPHSSAWRPRPDVSGRRLRGAARLEDAALRRATECDPLDARGRRRLTRGRALVEEHVDRAAPRGERLRRRDREEDGILVVLAHRHDPQVDAVLAQEPGQEAVEPLLQPLLLQLRLLAQRAERALDRRLRRRCHGEEDAEGECGDSSESHFAILHLSRPLSTPRTTRAERRFDRRLLAVR